MADRVLLPPSVEPSHYELVLTPDIDALTFHGTEKVHIDVKSACTSISLHAKEIHVTEASFANKATGKGPAVVSISYHLKDTTVTIGFDGELPLGEATLSLTFDGILNGDMAGFYKSGYTDADGNKKIMLSTQFQALDARRAFPCWDEPARKATFAVTLVVPQALTALSNMPETSCCFQPGGKKVVVFDSSPRMSTYLLAWAVGEFDFVHGKTKNGTAVRVYAQPGRADEGHFALNVAIRALEFYDSFFQVPYPLPKLDMLCCTEFAMGAMENWGLVTYREADLMISEAKGTATPSRRQRIAIIVSHELAHQWFGNLVTMEWWNDLWLNEGFAAFSEHFCVDALFPEWKIWEQYTTDAMAAALRLDSLKSSHPIQVPIVRAEEVEQVFDAISYCKGSTVVRMAQCVVGKDAFQKGLQCYMKKHAYGNTITDDLWNAWTAASGGKIDVAKLMNSWTSKMGHPYLTVVDEKWGADGAVTFTLEQNWFLADGSAGDPNVLWSVPLMFATATSESATAVIMSEKRQTFTLSSGTAAGSNWVKINAGQQALCRVAHSAEMIQRLVPAITNTSSGLSAIDRASLLLDAYALAKAGRGSVETVVTILKAFTNEESYTGWSALSGVLAGLNLMMEEVGGDAYTAFKQFAARIVKTAFAKVGWVTRPTDGHSENLVRTMIVDLLDVFCSSEPEILAEARRRFNGFMEDGDATLLPPDIKAVVFRIVLSNDTTPATYEKILASFHNTTDNSERKYAMITLGSASTKALKLRTLDWAVKGTEVKLQDYFYSISSVSGSKAGVELAWTYFKENVEYFRTKLGKASPSLMDAGIGCSCNRFVTTERADEIEAFFKATPFPASERRISQIVESIRTNGAFLNKIKASGLTNATFWA